MRTRLAAAHLDVMLGALNRACAVAVERQREQAAFLDRSDQAAYCITDREVSMLLQRVEGFRLGEVRPDPIGLLSAGERRAEAELRLLAEQAGEHLPLDELAAAASLGYGDLLGLLAVTAPELDRGYRRIYAYLADDPDHRHASVDTLLTVAAGLDDRHDQRRAFGPFGPLRRHGLVRAEYPSVIERHGPLSLGLGVLDYLLGARIDVALLLDADPAEAELTDEGAAIPCCSPYELDVLADGLQVGLVDTVGVWASDDDEADEAVQALARLSGRPLVTVTVRPVEPAVGPDGPTVAGASLDPTRIRLAALKAGATGGLLWLRLVGGAVPSPAEQSAAATVLAGCGLPMVISRHSPWRPAVLLAGRAPVEVWVTPLDAADREAVLSAELAGLSVPEVDAAASRWGLGRAGLRAAAGMARTASTLTGRDPSPSPAELDAACALMSTVSSGRLVSAIEPRRGEDLLVLPPAVHRQVTEIAAFARSARLVVDDWGFGRMLTGGGGVKALFVGDPGTGKTLAAEVIAHLLGVQLLKVDLAQLVSKWVGETAKHLDLVFQEAASGAGVLFFDEADALFGKRGEVRHGTDRYANTEVSHLLQRFEQHDGVVILASNLRDNIDAAFARRFDAIVPFPRPQWNERRRLWTLAFPPAAPLAVEVDLDAVAGLDMTGAGIVSAARLAALLAAGRDRGTITMADVVHGIVRQYHTEGRILTPADLGAYGNLAADIVADGAPLDSAGRGWG